ncbi:Lrp/AsnC family transcriptional regulator [Fulvivirga sp. RKSG066]|nr:Lrp/AsnC family transcriptional regulator [Fulvivirga aurantia]MTI20713.1 Lrp/AsnC family transcriptional regulator [Fulvivirga aurantia]
MALLRLLQQDAKMKHKELAAELGLTITPIYERIKRLEKSGVIKQYVTLLDPAKIGKELISFSMVTLEKHSQTYLKEFEKAAMKIEEVMECYHLAGEYDYLLKVVVKDMNSYQQFIVNKLSAINNVGQVQSSFALSTLKATTAYAL